MGIKFLDWFKPKTLARLEREVATLNEQLKNRTDETVAMSRQLQGAKNDLEDSRKDNDELRALKTKEIESESVMLALQILATHFIGNVPLVQESGEEQASFTRLRELAAMQQRGVLRQRAFQSTPNLAGGLLGGIGMGLPTYMNNVRAL